MDTLGDKEVFCDEYAPLALPWPEFREAWRPVPGYECYEVSSLGQVRSWRRRGKGTDKNGADRGWRCILLKQSAHKKYGRVKLFMRGEERNAFVHQLVLSAFASTPDRRKTEVRHLDGNPLNNTINNLCWGTPTENAADRARHGTIPRGENHPRSKITEDDVREMRRQRGDGALLTDLARAYGISHVQVLQIVRRRSWEHVA